jgi:hypothetical protein
VSAIVSTYVLSQSDFPELLEAAHPKKRLFAKPLDRFHVFLRSRGRALPIYDGSGFIFAPLFPFLKERGINIMDGAHGELARQLQQLRGALLYLFLDPGHKGTNLERLKNLSLSAQEFETFYAQFNESDATGAGDAAIRAVAYLILAIEAIPGDGVVLFEMS